MAQPVLMRLLKTLTSRLTYRVAIAATTSKTLSDNSKYHNTNRAPRDITIL